MRLHRSGSRLALTLLFILGPLFLAGIDAEENWTRFRGPNGSGSGVLAVFPSKWTDDDVNWRVELPGKGHSSPVIWGDYVILQSADEDNANHHVLCFHGHDGRRVWKRSFPANKYRLWLVTRSFVSGCFNYIVY